jgi:hypothetical protein
MIHGRKATPMAVFTEHIPRASSLRRKSAQPSAGQRYFPDNRQPRASRERQLDEAPFGFFLSYRADVPS